jgi:hypothetical protein
VQHAARIEMGHPIPRAVAGTLGTLEAQGARLCTGTQYHVCGFEIYSQLFNGHSQSSKTTYCAVTPDHARQLASTGKRWPDVFFRLRPEN